MKTIRLSNVGSELGRGLPRVGLRRAVWAVPVAGLAAAAVTARADVTYSVQPAATTFPGTPTIQTYTDPTAATIAEGLGGGRMVSQTFTPATDFKLGQLALFASGNDSTSSGALTIHLYDIQSPHSLPGSYRPSTEGQDQGPAPDLFGNGNGLSLTYGGNGSSHFKMLTFVGSDQVTLQAGHLYAFEVWAPSGSAALNWFRGLSAVSTYAGGDGYNAFSPIDNTTLRTQLAGSSRDFALAVYSTASLPAFPLQVDINGGNSSELHPNLSGWTAWNNPPTSGSSNNGNAPENGYPTAVTTKQFATSGVASGTVTASLKSVDINYSSSGNSYVVEDQTVDGRDLGSAGSTYSDMYRDFVTAKPGATVTANGNNGTNHRMEVQFTGLDPNTPYAITFYAYDNGNPNSVFVFTDVTGNPLTYLPAAQSSGTLNPGDGTGGTQYAPDGQYVANGTTPPGGTQDRAVTITATSDSTGKLIFAETTVAGLTPPSITNPVLSGFEIRQDKRTWAGGTSTNWADAGNWAGGSVPNGLGHYADFAGASAGTVNVPGGGVTVGVINFGGASYTLAGGPITLKDSSINSTLSFGNSGRARITLTGSSSNQTISVPLTMLRDTTVSVASGGTTLTVSNLQQSAVNLTKAGAGTLAVNAVKTSRLIVSQGTVRVLANGGASGVSTIGGLTIAGGATFDLADNDLVVTDGAALATVLGYIQAAFHGGAWDLPGLTSSSARDIASHATGLGWSDAGGQVLVKYTYYGDANLDGRVNGDDYALLDRGFAKQAVGPKWVDGDFNYDGAVTSADYLLADVAFGHQGGTLSPAFLAGRQAQFGDAYVESLIASVPEPGCVGVVVAAVGVVMRRRRRM